MRSSVLDFGCGVGALAKYVAPRRYIGVDQDADSLNEAKTRFPEHRFEMVTDFSIWVSRPQIEKFDTIVMLAVIEHLKKPQAVLRNLSRMLTKEGRFVLTTPCPYFEKLYTSGTKLGLFSKHANEEHETLVDFERMTTIAEGCDLRVSTYKRFLLWANQLFVLTKKGG
jgi:2-polyprenyl-3-methyl-5-hydroxy-6-metoxy-1,4-benzoquinol methylase